MRTDGLRAILRTRCETIMSSVGTPGETLLVLQELLFRLPLSNVPDTLATRKRIAQNKRRFACYTRAIVARLRLERRATMGP